MQGLPLSFSTNGSVINEDEKVVLTKESSGQEHINELLNILARLKLKKAQDFEFFINDISQNYSNTEVIILTSYLTKEICHTIRKIKAGKNNVSIMLLNTVEKENRSDDDHHTHKHKNSLESSCMLIIAEEDMRIYAK